MAVYGTNCLKFADGDEDESRPFLSRELHIVQPKLVVVMGEPALAFLNSLDVPARATARVNGRRAAAVHADDPGARRARHRRVARRAAGEDGVLERVQAARRVVGRAAAVLDAGLVAFVALLGVLASTTRSTSVSGTRRTWWDVAFLAFVLIPAVLRRSSCSRCRCARGAGCSSRRSRSACSRSSASVAGLELAGELREAPRRHGDRRSGSSASSRALSWVVLVAAIIPIVDAFSVFARTGRRTRSSTSTEHVFTTFSFAFPIPGETSRRTSACPTSSSSRCSSPRPRASSCARRWTWLLHDALLRRDAGARVGVASAGFPALPFLASAFLVANVDLIWARLRPRARIVSRPSRPDVRAARRTRRAACAGTCRPASRAELVAVVLAQALTSPASVVGLQRDVDDARRAELAEPPQRFAGEPARGGSTTTTRARRAAVAQLLERLADVAGEEGRVRDPVQLRVLERAGDRLLRDLDPPHSQRVAREREPDRADAAVEVVDGLAPGQRGGLARERVEPLGHRACSSEGTRSGDAEAQAAQLLLDRLLAPEELASGGSSPRPACRSPPSGSSAPPGTAQHVDEVAGLELLARARSRAGRAPAPCCGPRARRGGGGSRCRRPGRRRRAPRRAPSRAPRRGSRCRGPVVSQHSSISSTSSQRPARWKPSVGPSSVCVNEYSSLLR